MWWVIDWIFQRDRRAHWLRHWLLGTACIQTRQFFKRDEPVLLIAHGCDDEMWQLSGASDAGLGVMIGHLSHAIDEDDSLLDVLDLAPGELATRASVGAEWTRRMR